MSVKTNYTEYHSNDLPRNFSSPGNGCFTHCRTRPWDAPKSSEAFLKRDSRGRGKTDSAWTENYERKSTQWRNFEISAISQIAHIETFN